MGSCLHHVETIVRDQFFFMNFGFKCSEGRVKEKLTQSFIPYNGENCSSVPQLACKLQPFL